MWRVYNVATYLSLSQALRELIKLYKRRWCLKMKDGMIIKGDWKNFLDAEGEEILLVTRKHIFTVIAPSFFTILIFSFFSVAAYFVFIYIFSSFMLFVSTVLLLLAISSSLLVNSFIHWYFNMYILTTRKILEVRYAPLSSHIVNDVFLDKVNCTEIDLSSKGFFHELIDMGDVSITFDRPTHQEEFILQDIKNCDEVARFLTQKLMGGEREKLEQTLWFRSRNELLSRPLL
jgi:hypothetical protein